jgi:PIN domain nuclease of toxin-antitoxin system
LNLLLDTYAIIWYSFSPQKITNKTLDLINDTSNSIMISQVSIWEMQIKSSIGKLKLPVSIKEMVENLCEQNQFSVLRISNQHLWNLETLPFIHKDPFDRLLISQAQSEDVIFLSADEERGKYDIKTQW